MPESSIGIARGLGALFGVTATFAYPWAARNWGVQRTALRSVWLMILLLTPCVASIWVRDWQISAALLCGGVITSRVGLWCFDIAVCQIQQEHVIPEERGVVGAVQSSAQQAMYLLHFGLAIVFAQPDQFPILIAVSVGSLLLAAIFYSAYHRKVRGHLFHLPAIPLLGWESTLEFHVHSDGTWHGGHRHGSRVDGPGGFAPGCGHHHPDQGHGHSHGHAHSHGHTHGTSKATDCCDGNGDIYDARAKV